LLAPARPAAAPKRKLARGTEANPAADIQTER
jgi:hypothetical protein